MIRVIKIFFVIALFSILVGATYFYSNIVRCIFIDSSNFREIQENLYVSEHIKSEQNIEITMMLTEARKRIADFYGDPEASPTIIVTGNKVEAKNLGVGESPGIFFYAPWGNYLILNWSKTGIDVVAHELVHAEIAERLGYFKRMRKMPTWFDEGAALQVDFRPRYTEISSIEPSERKRITSLNSPSDFWSKDKNQNIRNYQSAKVAVAEIFREHPSSKLFDLLRKLKSGTKFSELLQ
jgi:hypothetical protein